MAANLPALPKDPPNWCWVNNVPPEYVEPKGSWNSKGEWRYR